MIVPLYRNICDNETFVHTDTLWYTNGNHTEVNTLVWKPGMTIPDTYTDVIFKGADGCDSIIYRYFLTINKTYYSEDTATLCSNEAISVHNQATIGICTPSMVCNIVCRQQTLQ